MPTTLARSGELRRLLIGLLGPGAWRLRSMTQGRGDRDKVVAERDGVRYFVKLMWRPGAAATRAASEIGLAARVRATGQLADGRAVVIQDFLIGTSGAERRGREWILRHGRPLVLSLSKDFS